MCVHKIDEIGLITLAIEEIEGQKPCFENTVAVNKLNEALKCLRQRSDEAEDPGEIADCVTEDENITDDDPTENTPVI